MFLKLVSIFIYLSSILLFQLNSNGNHGPLAFFLFLNVFVASVHLIRTGGLINNAILLFLGMIGFFLLNRIYLGALIDRSFQQTEFFTGYTFSYKTSNLMLLMLCSSVSGLLLGSCTVYKKISLKFILRSKYGDLFYRFILILSIVLGIYVSFLSYRVLFTNGYIAAFKDGFGVAEWLILSARILLYTAVSLSFFYKQNRKHVVFVALVTAVMFFGDGRRGPGLSYLLVTLLIYRSVFDTKSSFIRTIVLAVLLLFISVGIGRLRYGGISIESVSIMDFIYGQGISLQNLGYSVDFADEISFQVIDIFDPLLKFFEDIYNALSGGASFNGQVGIAEEYSIYSLHASKIVNASLFSEGFGMGGSYIAELYSAARLFGVFLGSLLLAFLLRILFALRSMIGLIVVIPFLASFIYLPRNNIGSLFLELFIFVILGVFSRYFFRTTV